MANEVTIRPNKVKSLQRRQIKLQAIFLKTRSRKKCQSDKETNSEAQGKLFSNKSSFLHNILQKKKCEGLAKAYTFFPEVVRPTRWLWVECWGAARRRVHEGGPKSRSWADYWAIQTHQSVWKYRSDSDHWEIESSKWWCKTRSWKCF